MKYLILFISVVFLVSCSNTKKEPEVLSTANPADVKCIENGYELSPIEKNGIVVSSMCINNKSGKKCKSWEYYRGECKLR